GVFGSSFIVAGSALKTSDLGGFANARLDLFGAELQAFMKRAARGLTRIGAFGEELPNLDNRIELAADKDEFGMPLGRLHHSFDQDAVGLWNANFEEGLRIAKATGAREVGGGRALRSTRASAFSLLALANLLWAGNWVIGRALRDAFEPVALNFWRWLIAALVLAPFALPELARARATLRRHAGLLALLALAGVAVFQTLVYLGLKTTTAINAVLLNSSALLFVISVAGLALLAPAFALEALHAAPRWPSAREAAGVLYIGLAASVAAFICWNRGVAIVGANAAGFTLHLLPAFGTALAMLLL